MLGAQGSPYLKTGEWQLFSGYRGLKSDNHFKGTVEQIQRHVDGTFKINHQNLLDNAVTYAVNRQWNVTLSVPLVAASRSNKLTGAGRFLESADGLGDISLTGRYWLLNTERRRNGNVSLGLGLQAPTGNDDVTNNFPNPKVPNGTFKKAVDSSVQPGSGGWGTLFDMQAFHGVGKGTLFFSALYLASLRSTNGTFSSTAAPNAVPDQFLARLGGAVPLPHVNGLVLSLAARAEGVPRKNLFTGSGGFRRPGHSVFIEPGLILSRGLSTWAISVPVAVHRQTYRSNLTDQLQDATLADYMVLASYSRRFGGAPRQAPKRLPPAPAVK